MSALTFMHLANHGSRNVGNAALILGLERVLREDLPAAVRFKPEPWDLYSRGVRRFGEEFVERVNASCDALLVGAAIAFEGSTQYRNTGFRFDLPLELWKRIDHPIIFYGLSHRAWPRHPYHNRDALRSALEYALGSERVVFSVRNDGTKRFLESMLGRPTERIVEVPDPALYVPVERSHHPELEPGKVNVVVALNAEDEPHRFGRARRKRSLRLPDVQRPLPVTSSWGWRESRDRFLAALAAALDRLAANHDVNIVFCSHDPFDVGMSAHLFGLLPPDLRYRVTFTAAALPVGAGPAFFDLYAQADLALSMRIHSMNPAVGLGTPLVPLVSQGRMSAFMTDAGLADLCVDIHGRDTAAAVYKAASRVLEDSEGLRARLRAATARLRERTADFNRQVAALVGAT